MANRRDGIETRRKILAAACEVFAESGFRGATNAEICRRSKVNGAAVNYHFRSKDALYQEAFKLALEESLKAHPPFADRAKPSEERMRQLVFSMISRISDPANMAFRILRTEMGEPTKMLDGIMHEFIDSEHREMETILKSMIPQATERELELCALSVLAQCVHPSLMERGRRERGQAPVKFSRPFDPAEMAEHVYKFSMAAIEARKRQAAQAPVPSGR